MVVDYLEGSKYAILDNLLHDFRKVQNNSLCYTFITKIASHQHKKLTGYTQLWGSFLLHLLMNFWERKGQKEEIKAIEGKALKKEKHISATEVSKLECQGREDDHRKAV